VTAPPPRAPIAETTLRGQLSSFRALLVLSMVMTKITKQLEILEMAATAVPSFGPARAISIWLDGDWADVRSLPRPPGERRLREQVTALPPGGGPIRIPEQDWGFAFPLTDLGGLLGYVVVASEKPPDDHDQFLLAVLAQNTGVALANARMHARDRDRTEELQRANLALQRSTGIHERLTQVAAAGEGPAGIARAVFELSGLAVAIEDRYGNLTAWAGPDEPHPYPKAAARVRDQLVNMTAEAARPLRHGDRLVALARPGGEVMGVIALIDPTERAGESEVAALEHGATVLAMELAHVRSQAESELRLRRDLVEELLAGTDPESAHRRARALDYDLGRPHRVIVIECQAKPRSRATGTVAGPSDAARFDAVRRAARDVGAGTLLVSRAGTVIVLSNAESDWERLRTAVVRELGGTCACRIGVGSVCEAPPDFPRSRHQAELALKMQRTAGSRDQVTVFESLGVYRMLSEVPDENTVEAFVREWLGALLDYDAGKGSALVETLSGYLECGGNYDATAKALSLHRSTLRYRLQRLREVSGHDLTDPDIRFNLQLATRAWGTLNAIRGE
jgi:sugar diacid utilization regulator